MRSRDRHQGVAVHRFASDVGDLAIAENGHTDLIRLRRKSVSCWMGCVVRPALPSCAGARVSPRGLVTLTGFTPNFGKLSTAALRNINGLASWRHAEKQPTIS